MGCTGLTRPTIANCSVVTCIAMNGDNHYEGHELEVGLIGAELIDLCWVETLGVGV